LYVLCWGLLWRARCRFGCRFPSVRKKLKRLKETPIFFIHGGKDSYIQSEHARILFDAAQQPRYLWLVEQAKHNQSVEVEPERYGARITSFFEKFLGGAKVSGEDKYPKLVNGFFDKQENFEHTGSSPLVNEQINEVSQKKDPANISVDWSRRGMQRGVSVASVQEKAPPLRPGTK